MQLRSLIIIGCVSCLPLAVVAQITAESSGCPWPIFPSEMHHLSVQPTIMGTSSGDFSAGTICTYTITDLPNLHAYSIGWDSQIPDGTPSVAFLEYARFFTESPAMTGMLVSGGVGISTWQTDRHIEVRFGVGYAIPLSQNAVLRFALNNRAGGDPFAKYGFTIKSIYSAGISLSYKIAETYITRDW